MSYGLRYMTGFKDISLSETLWEVKIFQKGYGGEPVEVESMGESPLTFTFGQNTRWLFEPVISSDVEFSLWASSRFQFLDLASADARKNRIDIYRNSALYWRGYIVADMYDEPLDLHDTPLRFMAADMKALEDVHVTLSGLNSVFEYVRNILNQLDYDFPYMLSVDIESGTGMFNAFRNTGLDASVFDEMNGADALKELLRPFGATCYQEYGWWYIVQAREKAKNYDISVYSKDGELIEESQYDEFSEAGEFPSSDFAYYMPGGKLQLIPPYKKFTIKTKLIKVGNKIKNGSFTDNIPLAEDDYQFNSWVKNTKAEPKSIDGINYVLIKPPSVSSHTNYYMFQDLDNISYLIQTENQSIRFSCKWAYAAAEGFKGTIRIEVLCGSKYLTRDGTWSDSVAMINIAEDVEGRELDVMEFQNFEITAPLLTGQYRVILFIPTSVTGPDFFRNYGSCFTDVRLEIVGAEDELEEEIESEHVVNSLNNYIPEAVELLFDKPPEGVVNVYDIYKNCLFPPIHMKYEGQFGNLASLLAKQIIDSYANPPFLMSATIESDLVTINSIIIDNEFPTRRFVPVYARFEPRFMRWEMEMISVNTEAEIIPDFHEEDFDGDDFYTN